jgi:hypothetical protein
MVGFAPVVCEFGSLAVLRTRWPFRSQFNPDPNPHRTGTKPTSYGRNLTIYGGLRTRCVFVLCVCVVDSMWSVGQATAKQLCVTPGALAAAGEEVRSRMLPSCWSIPCGRLARQLRSSCVLHRGRLLLLGKKSGQGCCRLAGRSHVVGWPGNCEAAVVYAGGASFPLVSKSGVRPCPSRRRQ